DVGVINAEPGSPQFNQVVAQIPIAKGDPGYFPVRVAVTPDGTRAYVTREFGGDVAVVDALALQEADARPTPPDAHADVDHQPPPKKPDRIAIEGSVPYGIAIDPQGQFAYVSDVRQGLVYVIDVQPGSPTFQKLVFTIPVKIFDSDPVPNGLRDLALDADG